MTRNVKTGIGIGCCFAIASLSLAREGRDSVTVGERALAAECLHAIYARGECPDILQPQSCGPEDLCAFNNCVGDPYNPYANCMDDCMEDAEDYCQAYAGNQQQYNQCMQFYQNQYCPNHCNEFPNRDVKECVTAVTSNKTHNEHSSYTPGINDADESNYTNINTQMRVCFTVCQCNDICLLVEVAPNDFQWVCQTLGGSSCTQTGVVSHATGGTPGECPPDQGTP